MIRNMHPAMSLNVQNASLYTGAECLALQKPNTVKRIEQLRETERIPQTIEIKPKALETITQGVGSRLNFLA